MLTDLCEDKNFPEDELCRYIEEKIRSIAVLSLRVHKDQISKGVVCDGGDRFSHFVEQ